MKKLQWKLDTCSLQRFGTKELWRQLLKLTKDICAYAYTGLNISCLHVMCVLITLQNAMLNAQHSSVHFIHDIFCSTAADLNTRLCLWLSSSAVDVNRCELCLADGIKPVIIAFPVLHCLHHSLVCRVLTPSCLMMLVTTLQRSWELLEKLLTVEIINRSWCQVSTESNSQDYSWTSVCGRKVSVFRYFYNSLENYLTQNYFRLTSLCWRVWVHISKPCSPLDSKRVIPK